MIRKYHNNTKQTNPWHPQNTVWAHQRLVRETPLVWHLADSPMAVRFQTFLGMKTEYAIGVVVSIHDLAHLQECEIKESIDVIYEVRINSRLGGKQTSTLKEYEI